MRPYFENIESFMDFSPIQLQCTVLYTAELLATQRQSVVWLVLDVTQANKYNCKMSIPNTSWAFLARVMCSAAAAAAAAAMAAAEAAVSSTSWKKLFQVVV